MWRNRRRTTNMVAVGSMHPSVNHVRPKLQSQSLVLQKHWLAFLKAHTPIFVNFCIPFMCILYYDKSTYVFALLLTKFCKSVTWALTGWSVHLKGFEGWFQWKQGYTGVRVGPTRLVMALQVNTTGSCHLTSLLAPFK